MTETEFEKRKKLFSDPSEYKIEPKLRINARARKAVVTELKLNMFWMKVKL